MDNEKMTATHTDEVRSWTVVLRQGKPVLLPTKWQPGYTPAHKETKYEALTYAAKIRLDQITGIQLELSIIGLLVNDLPNEEIMDAHAPYSTKEAQEDLLPLGFGIPELEEESDEEFQARVLVGDTAKSNGAPDDQLGQDWELTEHDREVRAEARARAALNND